jgi:hypothetical protein
MTDITTFEALELGLGRQSALANRDARRDELLCDGSDERQHVASVETELYTSADAWLNATIERL